MEFLLSLFASAVMAAELVLSPLADVVHFGPPPTPVPQPKVSFGQIFITPSASPAPIVLGEATPSATYRARQKHYAIALLGDSMIDTLGPDVPHLKNKLLALFPGTTFTMHNFGVGAENIDSGLVRVTSPYTYLGEDKPSLVSLSPDVIVVESFGYNPYSYDTGALEKHWLQLATIVDLIRNRLPAAKIIIAATIAPNARVFADGAPGLSFSADAKWEKTNVIKQYLDSTVKFAQSQNLPLADAYHASLMKNGDGNVLYINPGDHIHYSDAGRDLFAQQVVDAIITHKLLE